jgi:hypothetical protein
MSAQAADLDWIIVGRCIQGASGAILPLSFGLTREFASREVVPLLVGCLTGV